MKEVKSASAKNATSLLRKTNEKPYAVIIDGTADNSIIKSAEESGAKILVAKNFTTTETNLELMSF